MTTYADWAASRASGDGMMPAQPVKLIIDSQGNVLEQASPGQAGITSSSASQEDIARGVRDLCRTGLTAPLQRGPLFQLATSLRGPTELPSSTIILVVDTTWLLSHTTLFEELVKLIPRAATSVAPILLVIPGVVLSEIDYIQSSLTAQFGPNGNPSSLGIRMASLVKRASRLLQDNIRIRPDLFQGELSTSPVPGQANTSSDEQILSCCQLYHRKGLQVGLLSNDEVLCNQATAAGLTHMRYVPAYDDPEAFLSRLHPDLPGYFKIQRSNAMPTNGKINAISEQLPSGAGDLADGNLPMHVAESLLIQQRSAIAHLETNFPVLPPELLEIMSVVTTTLLAPVIYPALLQHMANGSTEIFAYMLSRSSILRDLRLSEEKEALDCTRWHASTCMRLLDQNWQMCFASQAATERSGTVPSSSTTAISKPGFSFDNSFKGAGAGSSLASTTGSSLSQSRWASASSKPATSTRRTSSGYTSWPNKAGPSTPQTGFHPSKLPALATSFTTEADAVLRWTPARWRLVLEDLELLLCGTALLDTQHNAKLKAEMLLEAARKNVDAWKQ